MISEKLYGFILSFAVLSSATGFSRVILQEDGVRTPVRVKRLADVTKAASFIRQALEDFKSLMKTGLPEVGIAPLEPVRLDDEFFDGDASGVQVKSNFTNMTMYGISTQEIVHLALTPPSTLNLQLNFKNWTIVGSYNLTGTVIKFIPLYGNGTFDMEATDVTIYVAAPLTEHPNGSLSVGQLGMDIKVGDVDVHFHDLYGGGSLSGIANRIASFFGNRIFNNAKPKLTERMKKFLMSSLNRKLKEVNLRNV